MRINCLNLRLLLIEMKKQLILLKHKRFIDQVGYVLLQKRYGFLIHDERDVLLIEDDEPTSYKEVLNNLESDT